MAKRFDYCERRRLARRDGKGGYYEFIWILSLCLDPYRLGKRVGYHEHFYHPLETFANESIHASCQRKVSGFTVFIIRELVLDRNVF
jgi:hypothetical protein